MQHAEKPRRLKLAYYVEARDVRKLSFSVRTANTLILIALTSIVWTIGSGGFLLYRVVTTPSRRAPRTEIVSRTPVAKNASRASAAKRPAETPPSPPPAATSVTQPAHAAPQLVLYAMPWTNSVPTLAPPRTDEKALTIAAKPQPAIRSSPVSTKAKFVLETSGLAASVEKNDTVRRYEPGRPTVSVEIRPISRIVLSHL